MATTKPAKSVDVPARFLQGYPPYPSLRGTVSFILETKEIKLASSGIDPALMSGEPVIIEIIQGRSYQGTFSSHGGIHYLEGAKLI